MRDYLLFVDTETSGIPSSLNASVSELNNWPFILQVAWHIYDKEGTLIKQEDHFIFEEEIYIEESSIKIHGITRDELEAMGKDRKSVMRSFAKDLRYYRPLLIGHFVEFDSKMLQVAMLRSGLKNIVKEYPHFCTMRATTEYTRFPYHEYPKLEDLYLGLFGEKIIRQHDAAVDAEATARCFFELYRKGELNDQLISDQPLFVKVKDTMKKKTGCGLPVLIFCFCGLIWIWL